MADLLPLYLRREPAREPGGVNRRRDVVAYRDEASAIPAGRWPWHYSNRPTKRDRRVMLNCYRWRAVWLPDLSA
jgi:hypothetical protein